MCLDPKTPYTDTPLNKWNQYFSISISFLFFQYFIENII